MNGFNTVDKATAAALHRMKSPEMEPLLKFFNNMAEEHKDALVKADTDRVVRLQGRASVLIEFLDAVDNAGSTLEKLNKP